MTELGPVLAGCRILVTAQRRADELGGALARRGAGVTVASALGVVPHVEEAALLESTRKIIADPVDVVVVTTGIGFRGWLDTAEHAGLADDLCTALAETRLVARGPKARGALQAAGLMADWVAESETAAEIADFLLAEGVDQQRIAVQRHGAGDDGLNRRLTGGGASVMDLEVYRWGPPPDPDLLRDDDRGPRERRVRRRAVHLGAQCRGLAHRAGPTQRDRRGPRTQRIRQAARRRGRTGHRGTAAGRRVRGRGARALADGRTRPPRDHGSRRPRRSADVGRSAAGPRAGGDARPPGALPVPVRLRRAATALGRPR